ncbi:MAG TPA: uracil-DNA glycosylase family protein, partial [archaeon]|nr:uracil-DNA glycosylase family protein [archaeon]
RGSGILPPAFSLMYTLEDVWKEIDNCSFCKSESNQLQHILGAGETKNPDLMIVFINPTSRNISSHRDWKGLRFPFIGRRRPWDIFEKVGWIDKDLLGEINQNKNAWSYGFAEKVLDYLKTRKLYITNIVKCTGQDAALPTVSKIKSQSHLFEKEVGLVNPKVIVAFGLLPTKALLKRDVKISDLYKETVRSRKPQFSEAKVGGKKYKVFPCYYPIGRGNPKKALEMIGYLNSYLSNQ